MYGVDDVAYATARRMAHRTRPAPQIAPEPPEWTLRARCRDTIEPDVFFPEGGGRPSDNGLGGPAGRAKAYCVECVVAADCLEYALEHNERHGVWGGLTRTERVELMKGRRSA